MFNNRGCLAIQKTRAMTNRKLDRNFFIIAITQKILAGFYLNLYPVVIMKFFISNYFFIFFPRTHRQLLSLSKLLRGQRDPALPYCYSFGHFFFNL
jgi:hypothetical protein